MGVLNLTPDSFYDGGRYVRLERAIEAGRAMLEAGADMLDVGGESTRPGAAPVSERDEIARVVPVIEALHGAPISIDTMKPAVARAAFAAGAILWNDVGALEAPGALQAAAELKAPVALMHKRGEPRTMQENPTYTDVVGEVIAYLKARAETCERAGLKEIWVDPGIGFGKTLQHNLALIRALPRIAAETGRPLLFGASRKSSIARLDPAAALPRDRLGGSIAFALAAAEGGARMVRVHDVRETVQALRVWRALKA
ncbi:MAG: dihydropteroate synthase [Hyphomonadaceae bacterium]|nr:dihydropteroate synthase [Hyphomonadaceae bacterium]